MKKIIDGKVYNTETAEEIADWDNGFYGGDFEHYREELYKTKKGNWFLYKTGGPRSTMAVSVGAGSTAGSSDIEKYTEKEAVEWLKKRQKIEILQEMFPNEIETA